MKKFYSRRWVQLGAVILALVLVLVVSAGGAQAQGPNSNTSGGRVTQTQPRFPLAPGASGTISALVNPVCVNFDAFSPEYSLVGSFPGGTFSPSGELRYIGSGWNTWNPQINGKHVLFMSGGSVKITFGTGSVGGVTVVAEPNDFGTHVITITGYDLGGFPVGSFSRSISGNAGAALLGLTSTANNINSVVISSDGTSLGFAFADLCVAAGSAADVPEGDTLLLMSGGLGGLATWLGWQFRKVRRKK